MIESFDTGDVLETLDQIERELLVSQQKIQSIGGELDQFAGSPAHPATARLNDDIAVPVSSDGRALRQPEQPQQQTGAQRQFEGRSSDAQAQEPDDPLASLRRLLARSSRERGAS